MDDFEVINRYRRLASRGAVEPLVCSMCTHDLVVRLGKDDNPMLRCYTCGTSSMVGAKMLLLMEHAIELYNRGRR